jgi:hypothetical protein
MFMCVSVQNTVQCKLPTGHLHYKYVALYVSQLMEAERWEGYWCGNLRLYVSLQCTLPAVYGESALTSYPLK